MLSFPTYFEKGEKIARTISFVLIGWLIGSSHAAGCGFYAPLDSSHTPTRRLAVTQLRQLGPQGLEIALRSLDRAQVAVADDSEKRGLCRSGQVGVVQANRRPGRRAAAYRRLTTLLVHRLETG